MVMTGRSWQQNDNYRYSFNGKETDEETGLQDYGFRIYNPAIAKFLSVDPLAPEYPWYTPYQFAGNTPIWAIDLDGLEPSYTTKDGDTYSSISEQFGVSVDELKSLNGFEDTKIPTDVEMILESPEEQLTPESIVCYYDCGADITQVNTDHLSGKEIENIKFGVVEIQLKRTIEKRNGNLPVEPTPMGLPGSPALTGTLQLTAQYGLIPIIAYGTSPLAAASPLTYLQINSSIFMNTVSSNWQSRVGGVLMVGGAQLPKSYFGLPRGFSTSSKYTNLISYSAYRFGDLKIGTLTSGRINRIWTPTSSTPGLLRAAGKWAPWVGTGLFFLDGYNFYEDYQTLNEGKP